MLKRTVLTEKEPIFFEKDIDQFNTEDSYQTGFEVSERVREGKKDLRALVKRTGFVSRRV